MNATEKEDLVQPLDPGLRALLLPEISAKIAMGAKPMTKGQEVILTFEGDAVRIHPQDFAIASKIAERVRTKVPRVSTRTHVLSCLTFAQQFLTETLFRPDAARVMFFATMSKASAFYRCLMPRYALNQGSRCVAHTTAAQYGRTALEYDVVVIQIDSSPAVQQFARTLQQMGKKVVYELDDAFDHLEEWHPQYVSYGQPERLKNMYEMMALADAVQVSTPWLAQHFGKHAKRIEVIPNMIELAAWPPADRLRSDGSFKVVWAGSPSHSGDLREVVPALREFAARHEDVSTVLFGQEIPESGITRLENVPWCDFEEYPFRLAQIDADVAIAPLTDVPFNHGKSNLRILQMWATGYPTIASPVGAYADAIVPGEDGMFAFGTGQWLEALEMLYRSKELRGRLAAGGRESVKRFDVRPNVERIEKFYADVAEGR